MRIACSIVILLAASTGCSLDFQAQKDLPAGLARRIAQKKAEADQRPTDAKLALELGELYIEGERWFEAAEALTTAKNNGGGDNSQVLGALATSYMSLGYYAQVETLLRDCFQRNRQEPGCLYAAGELMMLVGSKDALQAARTVWSNFVAVAPDHLKANYVRSALDQLNAQLGPPGQPSSQPSAGASSQPANPSAANGNPPSGGELPAGHPPAAPANNNLPAGHPPSADAKSNVDPAVPGHANVDGDADVGELNPFGVALQKALAATRRNDAPAAEKAYLEALKIRPNDVSALAGLAETQFVQKRLDDAVTTIEKAWAEDASDPQVRWIFGVVMIQKRKRLPEAVQAWEALARDTPQYAEQLDLKKKIASAKLLVGTAPSNKPQ